MSTRVRETLVVGDNVVVVWADGHESCYPGEALRRACSCAACKGETHLFGRRSLPTLQPGAPSAYQPVDVTVVGHYGLQVRWGDGHDHGIYHLDQLRAACPCPECTG